MTVAEFINKVGFKVNDGDVKKVNNAISGIKNTATKLLGAIGIGFSLVAINSLVEEFDAVNDGISNAVRGLEDAGTAQRKILDAANASKSSYKDMAGIVSNLVKSSEELFPLDDAIAFSSNVTKMLKTAGRSDSEITGIMDAMNKSFQKGIVDSETLNQLLEKAPEGANLLAKQLGVAKSELLQMAADGKMSVNDLKAAFIDAGDDIDAAFGQLNFGVSDAILNIRNKWGFWLKETDEMLGLTKTIGKVMVSAFDRVMGVLNRVRNGVMWLSDKLGGTDRLLRLLAISAGLLLVAFNFDKIKNGFTTIKGLLNPATMKIMAIVAAVIFLALIVEDFINFLQGNDSVIGSLLEKAGIDTQKVRDTIIGAWESIKKFLGQIWDGIKGAVSITWDAIAGFFSRHGEKIMGIFKRAWGFIQDLCSTVFGIIGDIIKGVFGDTESSVDDSQGSITDTIVNGWQKVLDVVMPILDALFEAWDAIMNAIMTVAEVVLGIVKKMWDKYGKNIVEGLRGVWNGIKKIVDGILTVIKGIATFVAGVFSGDWKKAWEGIKQIFSGVWKAIVGIFEAAIAVIKTAAKNVVTFFKGIWDKIKGVFSAVGQWFTGVFQAAWDGIVSVWSAVTGWFSGIWDSIVGVFSSVGTWFSERFSEAWENIKSIFSQVGEFFQGVWDTIVGLFTSIGTAVADAISGAVKGAINAVLSGAVGIINGFISAINFAISAINLIPGVNIKKLDKLEAPQLAEGGYVEANNPRHVIIGDNKHEGEIVSPISKMRDTMLDALRLFMAAAKPATSADPLTGSSMTRNIVQNVNINNKFEGDKAIQQKAAGAMDKSAKDVTSELARGLSYA